MAISRFLPVWDNFALYVLFTYSFYFIITQAAVIFNPYQPHVGATGALFGAVGLLFVELVHFWSIIRRPWLELIKLLTIMAVFIFSGTLPYLNIFSILAGLLLGMLCALGLLPYISIKRHKALCRIDRSGGCFHSTGHHHLFCHVLCFL